MGHRPIGRQEYFPQLGSPPAATNLCRFSLRPKRLIRPGELAKRLAGLTLDIDECRIEIGSVPTVGYYDGAPRPTGTISLIGGRHVGRGENVDWTPEDQAVFKHAAQDKVPIGQTTVGDLIQQLEGDLVTHHRAAIEAAAIDLGLRQAESNPFEVAGLPAHPVTFCWSIGRDMAGTAGGLLQAVRAILETEPSASFKLDVPPGGWPESMWSELAAIGGVRTVDFKRQGAPRSVALAHQYLPEAWLEDPPLEALEDDSDQSHVWADRVTVDGYVMRVADLAVLPFRPAAINVKAPRMGGPLEALRCIDLCHQSGWACYIGGMFEVGPGRLQARVLASLFSSSQWNDLAPIRVCDSDPYPSSPLPMSSDYRGFGKATVMAD